MMSRRRGARSAQQLRDDASNAERMSAYGEANFLRDKNHLRQYFGRYFCLSVVQMLAVQTATALGYIIDRCSRRKFDMLVLWLLERWDNVGPLFVQNMNDFIQQQAQPQAIHPQAVQQQANEGLVVPPGIEQVEPGIEDQSTIIAINQEDEDRFNEDYYSIDVRQEEDLVEFQEGDPFNTFENDFYEFDTFSDQDF